MLTAFLIIICWIFSVCLHEFGHAIVAYWGGDVSVKEKGYLTLNPLKYIDINMSIILPVFFLLIGGIALPGAAVYIQKQSLRNRYWQSAVSASGPLASIFCVLFLSIPFRLNLSNSQSPLWAAIGFLIMLNICGILLNLLPIPPLDGYGIIEPWLPRQTQIEFRKFSNYGIIALFFALSYYKPFNKLLWDSTFNICKSIGVSQELMYIGQESFKRSSGILVLIIVGLGFLSQRLNNPAKFSYEKGNQFLRTKKYEEAITCYNKTIKLQPNSPEAWYNKGIALLNLQKYEEAITCYEKSIKLKPNWVDAWYNQGTAYLKLQKYKEAIAFYDRVIQIHSNYINAWYNRGLALFYLQQYEQAVYSYDKVIQIDPAYLETWHWRGIALAALKQYEESIISYDKMLEIQPNNLFSWNGRGLSLAHLKKYKEAIASFNKVIKINPSFSDAWYNKACCYAEQNNTILAIKNLQKALSLDPIKTLKYAKNDTSFLLIREDQSFQKLINNEQR